VDEFGYLSVLLSIILGLAATEILQGWRRLLLVRERVVIYWPVIAWSLLFLLIVTQVWWTMFGMRARTDWTFGQFAIVMFQTILVYMQAGLIFPDFSEEGGTDLKQHYYRQSRWLFSLLALTLVVSIAKDLILNGTWPDPSNIAFHALFFTSAIVAVITRRESYHKFLAIFAGIGFVTYIAALFTRLH
jgi:hypothetical protein